MKRSFSTFWWSADKQQWRHRRLRTAFSRLAILDEKNRLVILHYDRWLYDITLTKHRRNQMHRVPKSNNLWQAPRVRVQWVYLLLRYEVKNPFHNSKFVSWRMRVICRKCYWELSLERTKRTCLSLVYVTTRKQPSATNPFPPTERQNHCVTCPSGTRRDACTRETVRPDTDANWGEKKEEKNTERLWLS